MDIQETELAGVLILTPKRFGDHRGYFSETYSKRTLAQNGIDIEFVQDNQSVSRQAGTVRGLHYQSPPHAQDKLVRVVWGRIFDVAVDFRKGSATFGKWVGVELSEENGKQLFVPKGFLHGFITREPNSVVVYKCSDTYAPDCDGAIHFADPDIGVNWGIDVADVVLSDKDRAAPRLSKVDSPFFDAG
ncbi:dTDP-4-dehydrorhamnose 3,5-epimerase [Pseudaestuariivita rosea]|uniref:dTDP-4-dehydrorhamnose 3,5-epimerase n=1 Tax=Pseudaestuariivita rosea TaxID=2763263 RepID=UPI001ABB8BEB|nr:dTDP-4-dehydrorhamnose 3,5-epimerase [Pseudaestuariivita rosea]